MSRNEYVSPDGSLTLVVMRDENEISLGFAGYPWHTHEDILDSILANQAVIAVSRKGGVILDIWVTDDVSKELRYREPDEQIEFRYWNGASAQ